MNSENTGVAITSLAHRIYRWEGLIFNVLCALYFLFLAPIVIETASSVLREPDATSIWLGVVLLVVSLAEIWAFPVKLRFVHAAARDHGDSTGGAFLLWMFHAVISVIIVMMVAACLGVAPASGDTDAPAWMAIVMPIVVIKELAFLAALASDGNDSDGNELPPADRRYARPSPREWIADAILVAYACVAYSATWSTLTRGMDLQADNPVMFALNLFVAGLLFLIFYLPLRIPYWIEEMPQAKSARDRFRLAGSVLVVMVPALLLV